MSGRCFERMSVQRRSLLHPGEYGAGNSAGTAADGSMRRRTRTRRPRSKRRNTLAGTDQKEIRDALTAGFVAHYHCRVMSGCDAKRRSVANKRLCVLYVHAMCGIVCEKLLKYWWGRNIMFQENFLFATLNKRVKRMLDSCLLTYPNST